MDVLLLSVSLSLVVGLSLMDDVADGHWTLYWETHREGYDAEEGVRGRLSEQSAEN